jgi:short-subunit dehydrogenase
VKWLFFPYLGFDRSKLQQRLTGKTVLITGASYGIGECTADLLAAPSVRLILVARTEEKLLEIQARLQARGGSVDIFACNLADINEVELLLTKLHRLPDGIDIVINNAGKSIRRSIFDSLDRFHDFSRTMNLNYFAPVRLLLSLVPILVAKQGHIINISAINVLFIPAPKWAAYQASKTAFDQWFRCVAPELTVRGVSTTSIYLPLVRTRMILPTKAYDRVPAMEPEQVAALIAKSIVSRRRIYAPWWTMLAELASILLRLPWEMTVGKLI